MMMVEDWLNFIQSCRIVLNNVVVVLFYVLQSIIVGKITKNLVIMSCEFQIPSTNTKKIKVLGNERQCIEEVMKQSSSTKQLFVAVLQQERMNLI